MEKNVGRELTPRCGKGICELWEVIDPGLGNDAVDRILAQGKIADQHSRVAESVVERVRVVNGAACSYELSSAGRAFSQGPVVVEETVQVVCIGQHDCETRPGRGRLPLLHFVGVLDQITSKPLVMVSSAFPVPKLLAQPKSWASRAPPSGGGPKAREQVSVYYLRGHRFLSGKCSPAPDAPWVFPKAWPPAIKATVSESFIPIRPKASRISRADDLGSPFPLGP